MLAELSISRTHACSLVSLCCRFAELEEQLAKQGMLDELSISRTHTCSLGSLCCRFVELVEQLGKQGKLDELGITPLMCAAASTPYAAALVARLQAAADKAVILTSFLGPQQLALVRLAFTLMPAFNSCLAHPLCAHA